jgi:hypothetical protein
LGKESDLQNSIRLKLKVDIAIWRRFRSQIIPLKATGVLVARFRSPVQITISDSNDEKSLKAAVEDN